MRSLHVLAGSPAMRGLGLARAFGVVLLFACAACSRDSHALGTASEQPHFVDAESVPFVLQNGFDGQHWRVVETIAGGVALFDYDGDGGLDLYFANGCPMEPGASPPRNALYRNTGGGTFLDVSKGSGVDDPGMSLGVCAADVDGDGRTDLYVTNLGPNRLYLNRGGGTFEDVAAAAGVAGASMDTGCAFFDMDADGDLDLYVASYVIDEQTEHAPAMLRGSPAYWPPLSYEAAHDHLFENRGGLRFIDVSEKSGIREVETSAGLGVIAADFNGDGHMDLYVANDISPNFMFHGDGTGKFTEVGFLNGTAFGDEGDPLGSMGVDAADYDGDGRLDLVVTNYQFQPNNLYRALGGDEYEERAFLVGMAAESLPEVSWGVAFADLDHDGREDLFVANGHLNPHAREINDSSSYAQKNRVFQNLGTRFRDMSREWGPALAVSRVSRGTACGDLDNDGDLDIVVSNIGEPAEVLRNDMVSPSNWSMVELVGSKENRSAIGARVTLTCGAQRQTRERRSSASYLSAGGPRLHFGLGAADRIHSLHVRWPDGTEQVHQDLPVRRRLTLRHGAANVEIAER